MNSYQNDAEEFLTYLYDEKVLSRASSCTPKNFGELSILGLLEKTKESTSGQLASMMNLKTSRVAALLNTLEKKGEIIREKAKDDKRITIVRITEKGEKAYQNIYHILLDNISLLYEKIGKEEMNQFRLTLSKIYQVFKENNNHA